MKVLLYSGDLRFIKHSGLGKAVEHQKTALASAGVIYTTNPADTYDIVHMNTYFPKSVLFAKKMKRKGIPVVYHAHSTKQDFRNSFRFSNVLAPHFEKWIVRSYNLGDVVVTPTAYAKALLEESGVTTPIYPISNGIDLQYYAATDAMRKQFREAYGYNEQDKIVMAVGHYIKRKGILDFVELAKRLPEYKFIWFGYTSMVEIPSEIQEAVKVDLPNLQFAGYIPAEELRNAYAGVDLFLFPTYEETEGIVLLEAMAMQQNILLRDIPIYSEYISGEHVYKAADVVSFAETITKLFNGELPTLVFNAYEEVKKRDINQVGEQLRALYAQTLSRYHDVMGNGPTP